MLNAQCSCWYSQNQKNLFSFQHYFLHNALTKSLSVSMIRLFLNKTGSLILKSPIKYTPYKPSIINGTPLSFSSRRFNSHVKKKKTKISTLEELRRKTNNEAGENIINLVNENVDVTSEKLAKYLKSVTSVTFNETIKFNQLKPVLSKNQFDYKEIIPNQVININLNNRDLIILSTGTIIGWEIDESYLINKFIPLIESTIPTYSKSSWESDELDFIELQSVTSHKTTGNSFMVNDLIVLQGNDDRKFLDKLAFSIGFSRSTRLSILENELENFINMTKLNSQFLAEGKAINSNESDILKLTGRLFLLRGKLNLYNELIDTPDFYWNEPNLEKIYQVISNSLDINLRISILNRKIDYATEEQRVFLSLLNEKKSTRLEWTIIILIMVEVAFETYNVVNNYH